MASTNVSLKRPAFGSTMRPGAWWLQPLLDIEHAILTGEITSRLTKDPRGARYEIVGEALDGRQVAVLCRMLSTGWLRIITVFALGSDDL